MEGALCNVKVLDLTRVLAGPYCTMILGDLGADVIKVESPQSMDETRTWGPPFADGESAYYLCANRNKRAMTLNLKTSEGQEIFKRLVADSDVVVQNFKAGTLDRLGLGYEVLREINPQVILASITGFGLTGPFKQDPGYDYIIQAMSGLMSITGDSASGPMKVGVAIADVLTGLYTAIGILSALHERSYSGMGQEVDISLLDSQLSALVNIASNYLISGKIPKPLGNQHPNIVPYQVFPTFDQDIVVAIGNDRQFSKFADLIGRSDLSSDDRFSTNEKRLEHKEELIRIITGCMKQKPAHEWQELLRCSGIPNGPINNVEKALEHPQVQAREMVVEMAHPIGRNIKLIGSPLKLSRTKVEMRRHPPLYGEHTQNVLHELGFTNEEIKTLKTNQIV